MPALLQHASHRREHAISGGGKVILLEQAPDLEHMGAAEPLPGHGFGVEDLGRAAGDRLQGRQLRPPRGRSQAVQVGGDRVLEVTEVVWLFGIQSDQIEDMRDGSRLLGDHRSVANCLRRKTPSEHPMSLTFGWKISIGSRRRFAFPARDGAKSRSRFHKKSAMQSWHS